MGDQAYWHFCCFYHETLYAETWRNFTINKGSVGSRLNLDVSCGVIFTLIKYQTQKLIMSAKDHAKNYMSYTTSILPFLPYHLFPILSYYLSKYYDGIVWTGLTVKEKQSTNQI